MKRRSGTLDYAAEFGVRYEPAEIELTEEEVFNLVRGFHTIGKYIP